MKNRRFLGAFFMLLVACADDPQQPEPVVPRPDAGPPAPTGVAPPGVIDGEQPLADGDTAIDLAPGATLTYRLETQPGQHVGFGLVFPQTVTKLHMTLLRWDGEAPVELGVADGGVGVRFLAAMDQQLTRTYWLRLDSASAEVSGTLTTTRTAFTDGIHCHDDCATLLQLPLANDPAYDGYKWDAGTIFRYQFGRRDLVMYLRYTARQRVLEGKAPVIPYDFSQWDGQTPGTDVGAPRHLSHQRGKDVDVSIYGDDGLSIWRSYCTTEAVSGGRQCIPGTRQNFDGYETAREIGHFFESGRVTMCFLDQELIAAVVPGAADASGDGFITSDLVPLFGDGVHIQPWPNHDNHVHVRVSETTVTGKLTASQLAAEPFEAP
jgi:hypothetical protein